MAPLIAGKPNPANNPIIEITTNNSTKVKASSFLFGNFPGGDNFMTMTKPNLPHMCEKKSGSNSFTMVELMGVITIIGVLAGLTLGGAGAVRRHGAVSQAKSEIAALQAACERYFAENNSYPTTTSMPNPSSSFNPTAYTTAGQTLFTALFGTNRYDKPPANKRYFEPKSSMVSSANTNNPYLIDPWGYAYGYNSDGTNAPLIWSTAGQTSGGGNTNKWITSWPKQ